MVRSVAGLDFFALLVTTWKDTVAQLRPREHLCGGVGVSKCLAETRGADRTHPDGQTYQ